jgi:CDP-diacylglycerol--glycerol-3-phosphate 3-phosphatidyltransferase
MRYTIPNMLTLARVVCVPVLWLLAGFRLSAAFAILFVLAGISDVADGFVARKLHQTSGFGAWFDSFADNLISASVPFWLWLQVPAFVMANMAVFVAIITLFVVSIVLGYWRYGRLVSYHLYSNKVANVFLYLFVLQAVLFGPNMAFFVITVIILAIALVEEVAVTLTRKHPAADASSFFSR